MFLASVRNRLSGCYIRMMADRSHTRFIKGDGLSEK